MELLHTSAMSRGFTLVEMVLVLSLIGLIGVSAQSLFVSSLTRFSCFQAGEELRRALVDARFQALFISNTNVPVLGTESHVFVAGRGGVEPSGIDVPVSPSSTCSQNIQITHVGEII